MILCKIIEQGRRINMLKEKKAEIINKVRLGNVDNISRTVFYEHFYREHPEIKWALLAGMVSRNAGWNMTDLKSKWFQTILTPDYQELLFQTFERANWTIFADAYPQLLWYESEKTREKPRFDLLKQLGVSKFMQNEWEYFMDHLDEDRLCTALIVNEQHMIEETVMKYPLYRDKVFSSLLYNLEEFAHMSYVLFPTLEGKVYGLYVRDFKKVKARIWLGKQLKQILFDESVFNSIYQFSIQTPPTGSRQDYQQYMMWSTRNNSPCLREVFPVVKHHWEDKKDWSNDVSNPEYYFYKIKKLVPKERTNWLQRKWFELYVIQKLKRMTSS